MSDDTEALESAVVDAWKAMADAATASGPKPAIRVGDRIRVFEGASDFGYRDGVVCEADGGVSVLLAPAPPTPDVDGVVAKVRRAIASAHYEGFQDGKKGNTYSTFDKSRALANSRIISATLATALEAATANPAPPAPDVAAVLAEADMYCENHNGMTSDLISTLRDALARVAKERDAAIAKYNNLFEVWPESLGWCEHEHRYHYMVEDGDENPDSCMQCERDAALARAEKAEESALAAGYLTSRAAEWVISDASGDRVTQAAYDALRAQLEQAERERDEQKLTVRAMANGTQAEAEALDKYLPDCDETIVDGIHQLGSERDALRAERDKAATLIGRVLAILSSDWEPDGDLTQIEMLAVALRAELAALQPILDCEITEVDWHAQTMRVTIPVDGPLRSDTLREFLAGGGSIRVADPV